MAVAKIGVAFGRGNGTATDLGQFGEALRLERERRGLTLDTLSECTKLSVRQLEDLEGGNHSALPGGVFRKGFLRSYLAALALDEGPWLEQFAAIVSTTDLAADDDADWGRFAANVKSHRVVAESPAAGVRWLGLVGMAIVVLIAAWCLWAFVVRSRVEAGNGAVQPPRQSAANSAQSE